MSKWSLKMQFAGNKLHRKMPKSEITFKIKYGEDDVSATVYNRLRAWNMEAGFCDSSPSCAAC